jgi:uncharacterized protein YbjT (DUF2867 family)
MKAGSELILVTGATGHQGGATAHELLAAGHRVRAMTRKPDSDAARALVAAGAEVVRGDLDEADSLRDALRGVWGAYAVQNTWEAGVEREEEQGKRFAQVARQAGVQHFVYASVASAHRKTGIPHFDNKARVEETILAQGFPSHTIIRPVFFMENFLGPWFKGAIDNGQLVMSVQPTTRLQMIAVQDIGKYGLMAFEKDAEMKGRAVDIAGDELTMPETARMLSDETGREIVHVQPPIEEVRKGSMDYAIMLEWFDAVGYNVDIHDNAREFGIPPTRFADWAKTVSWK